VGATIFILIGLVLLVDFAHSWSETCLEKWENSDSALWQFVLVGSSLGMYAASIAMTGVLYAFFASSGCTLNRFFISFNLALCVLITILSIHPVVQDANPRSGLSQSSMVAAYCTYLIMSAVGNHTHKTCNPIHNGGEGSGTQQTTVILGALFTFLAVAYSTTRAATQSRALVGKGQKSGAIQLSSEGDHEVGLVTTQPSRKDNPRYQAILAAVQAGAIPASALNEEFQDDDDDDVVGEDRDDEKSGTRYNYSWFHVIFVMAAMYVGMLLTDWNVVKTVATEASDQDVYIGRSETAMWIRVVSSWICMLLYIWSLIAPVVMANRFN